MVKRIFKRFKSELSVRLPICKSRNIEENLIVSLTSYPARLSKLHIVIRSLLKQSVSPAKIILYLGKDTKESDIPAKLQYLTKYNFEIKTNYDDIKPHKKYFFAMQEFTDKTIVTVDDDLIYDRNLIKDLINCSKNNPNCVCARRVNQITKKDDGSIADYKDWNWEYKKELQPSHQLLATGCGGVLYPPNIMPKETFDIEAIKKYCLNTDDIWLKFMELKNNIKIVWSNSKIIHPLSLRGSQESGLLQTNTKGENRNDINIKNMIEYTGINPAEYF